MAQRAILLLGFCSMEDLCRRRSPNLACSHQSGSPWRLVTSFQDAGAVCFHFERSRVNMGAPSVTADMLRYINKAWTPFHAVEEASRMLLSARFKHISEKDPWKLKAGGKYFFTRNKSTLVAFSVGEQYRPGNGFNMIGAHTDSPCLKLKPRSTRSKSDYLVVNVEPYGGGLWQTWFDRDLSVAGRVLVREVNGSLSHKLVRIEKPILRIPMLAIHLYRDIRTDGFKPNPQEHLAPILATSVKTELLKKKDGTSDSNGKENGKGGNHHIAFLETIAKELQCEAKDIVDFELNVCDTQPGVVGGASEEFVFVGRLDNLCSSYCSLKALIDACDGDGALSREERIQAVALFDHEEVGSESAQGAGGPVMRDAITRVARNLSNGEVDAVERCLNSSFLVSADMAHALHPNYAEKHDPCQAPKMHGGLVVKTNVNQRYATNLVSAALFIEVGNKCGVPSQHFSVRNDMPCGSTIGPILASNLGCRTVDVGAPQLAMHSIREMCGVDDVEYGYRHFKAFFEHFSEIDKTLEVDSLPSTLGVIDGTECHSLHT